MAYEKSLTLRIIAGRHSSNIQNPDFYLDISNYTNIKLHKNILTAGGGINQGNVYQYLFDQQSDYHFVHGVKMCHPLHSYFISRLLNNSLANSEVFPGGSAGSVCVGGFTTGGGIGSLKRTYGLTIDNVLEYQIIVPPNKFNKEATQITTTKNNNNDLFWALSGGLASNFGVITQITYLLPKINKVIMYSIVWPWNLAKQALTLWLQTAPTRSFYYNEDIALHSSLEDSGIEVGGLYVIPDTQTTEEALNYITNELQYLVNIGGTFKTQITSYSQTMTTLANNRVYYPFSSTRVYFSSNQIDVDYVVAHMNRARSINGLCLFGIELLGGKISEKPSSEAAFYPRQADFFYDIFAYCQSSLDFSDINLWVKEFFDTTYNPNTDNVFIGFQIPNLVDHLTAYYGNNKYRLIDIKNKYDPFGVMNYPQGINI